MLYKLDISRLHPFWQLLLLSVLVLVGMLFSSLFSVALGGLIWGADTVLSSTTLSGDLSNNAIMFLKISQLLIQIGTMLIPPLVFAYFYQGKSFKILNTNKINLFNVIIVLIIPFLVLPFVGMLTEWNQAMRFPEKLFWLEEMLRSMENRAAEATQILLRADTMGGLLLNIFVIAVIPAVSEEVLFRGVIQNVFRQWFKNVHWAVIVTAIVFSAIHGQFFGFLPRFALGLMLGYLFVYSGSIWAPIIAHFINNAAVTIISFLEAKGIAEMSAEEFGMFENSLLWGVISLVLTVGLIYLMFKNRKESVVKEA